LGGYFRRRLVSPLFVSTLVGVIGIRVQWRIVLWQRRVGRSVRRRLVSRLLVSTLVNLIGIRVLLRIVLCRRLGVGGGIHRLGAGILSVGLILTIVLLRLVGEIIAVVDVAHRSPSKRCSAPYLPYVTDVTSMSGSRADFH
jgi:hypothetical protein